MADDLLFDRFAIVKPIAEGGMGSLFLVQDVTEDHHQYALKILKRNDNILTTGQNAEDEEITEQRFYDEYDICKRISHPNVVKAYDYFEHDDVLAYTMEYIDGYDLSIIRDGKENTLAPHEVEHIAVQLLKGLREIHKLNQVHRDLKPENVLINPNGSNDYRDWEVKVSDLGLAKKMLGDDKRTAPAKRLGTAQYMSPEYHDKRMLTSAHDVFSFGIIMYELFTNTRSDFCYFDKKGGLQFRAVTDGDLRGIPLKYRLIIKRCMALAVADRYQSVQQVLFDLDSDEATLVARYKDVLAESAGSAVFRAVFGSSPLTQILTVALCVGLLSVMGVAAIGMF